MSYDWMSKAGPGSGGRKFVNFSALTDGECLVLEEAPRAPERSAYAVFEAACLRYPGGWGTEPFVEELLAPGPSIAGLIKMSLPPARDLCPGDRLVARVTFGGSPAKRAIALQFVPKPLA